MKKSDKLHVYWPKREKDLMIYFPVGAQTKCDAHYLSSIFNQTFTNELVNRGYDITTIKFSIEPQKGNEKFVSQRKGNQ